MKKCFMLVILFSPLFPFDAYAVFRCEGRIINGGYSKLDVMNYCGKPELIDSYTATEKVNVYSKPYRADSVYKVDRLDRVDRVDRDGRIKAEIEVSCKSVDQWFYTYGFNNTTYVIEFEGGYVARIRKGRGKPE